MINTRTRRGKQPRSHKYSFYPICLGASHCSSGWTQEKEISETMWYKLKTKGHVERRLKDLFARLIYGRGCFLLGIVPARSEYGIALRGITGPGINYGFRKCTDMGVQKHMCSFCIFLITKFVNLYLIWILDMVYLFVIIMMMSISIFK